MYGGLGYQGVGIDWGAVLQTGIDTAGKVVTGVLRPGSYYPGGITNPETGYQRPVQTGTSFLTFAILGIAGFLLVKTFKGR
jgi:hypothetical protein